MDINSFLLSHISSARPLKKLFSRANSFVCLITLSLSVSFLQFSFAEKTEAKPDVALKMMIVNPSTKYTQTYPMKAYLPEEVKPEHITSKDDLEITYDSNKRAYFVSKSFDLKPGESVVKEIKIKDIWYIPNEKMDKLGREARDLMSKLKDTEHEDKARLLFNNIELLLMKISVSQADENQTPERHISNYRENNKRMGDLEMDLMALRRFLAGTGIDLNDAKFGKASSGGLMPLAKAIEKELANASTGQKGSIPAWVLWKLIFFILSFLGIITAIFVLFWQRQISTIKKREKLAHSDKTPEEKEIHIGDFLSDSSDSKKDKVA